MIRIYTPNALMRAAAEVRAEHRNIQKRKISITDEDLKALINLIVSLKKEQIPDYVNLLTKYQITVLADYLPKNKFDADCTNIILILKQCMNINIYTLLKLSSSVPAKSVCRWNCRYRHCWKWQTRSWQN